MTSEANTPSIRHYFVDESGSGVIFNAKGRVVLGKECPSFFFLGAMACEEPKVIEKGLGDVWRGIINDPYMASVPSIVKRINSTGACFHATDDPPEVRREVFQFLIAKEIKLFAVVKDMNAVLKYVRSRNQVDPGYRYTPNELYDFTVRLLFPDKLHKYNEHFVHFARRGKSDRTAAIVKALDTARQRFGLRRNVSGTSIVKVSVESSRNCPGLQAVDYFLWALQRFYEIGDVRYLSYIWPKVSPVLDADDRQEKPYGTYYTQHNPLSLAKIKNRRI